MIENTFKTLGYVLTAVFLIGGIFAVLDFLYIIGRMIYLGIKWACRKVWIKLKKG